VPDAGEDMQEHLSRTESGHHANRKPRQSFGCIRFGMRQSARFRRVIFGQVIFCCSQVNAPVS
jgi:hypothetical protein